MVLSEQIDDLLTCQDVWRCSECGTCTRNCPMEVDTKGVMAAVRGLQRESGTVRCPELAAAQIAERRLARNDHIDSLAFGAAMVTRGHLPRDPVGSAGQGAAAARNLLTRAAARVVETTGLDRSVPALRRVVPVRFDACGDTQAGAATAANEGASKDESAPGGTSATGGGRAARPFFAGCSLPQDPASAAAARDVARGLGLPLAELHAAGCCGHPTRGSRPAGVAPGDRMVTVCPACDASLREAGAEPQPLWEVLLEQAHTSGRRLHAAAPAFVPYVGCLVERERGLATMRQSAELAGVEPIVSYPSLHTACCGGLGGVFRGESHGSLRLIELAVANDAPIVTTCLLCRDNVRSAARRTGQAVEVSFWPEFFTAAAPIAETDTLPGGSA